MGVEKERRVGKLSSWHNFDYSFRSNIINSFAKYNILLLRFPCGCQRPAAHGDKRLTLCRYSSNFANAQGEGSSTKSSQPNRVAVHCGHSSPSISNGMLR